MKVGPEADVRGLGVTLWELLTRRRLFAEAEDEAQLSQLILGHDVPQLRSVDATLDRDLEAIVARATERVASDRIATALQMADYLQMWLDGQLLPIRTPAVGELLWRWVRAHKPLVGSVAAVLLAAVACGGSAWWVQHRQKDTDASVTGLIQEARQLFEQAGNARWEDAPLLYVQARDRARNADDLARRGGASVAERQEAADLARSLEEEEAAAGRDRRLLLTLLEVRGPREFPGFWADAKGVLHVVAEPSAEDQFRAAFRVWDPTFDVDTMPTQEMAGRLKRRPATVVTEVVAALDEWSGERGEPSLLGSGGP